MFGRGYGDIIESRAMETLENIIVSDNFITLVDSDIKGVISFAISKNPFNHELCANEFLWYSDNSKLFVELFNEAEKHLDKLGANLISIGFDGRSSVYSFLFRNGYVEHNKILTKRKV
jgi:hypothetical protein